MAKPRVFISSTYYDLRYVREDLERFIRDVGYEPVRHETGSIPYSKEIPLEESAYKEVSQSDIIVCIVGGRYGTESSTREGSITQNELKDALKNHVQVYVFVEQNVHAEFSTYKLNYENTNIKYGAVDNVAVYQFLETIYALPHNNPITPFATSAEISNFLRNQWAGLFQRYLSEEKRISEVKILEEMISVASTLKELVTFLTEERRNKDKAIENILLSNHPAFRAFAKLTGTKYRIFFTNLDELNRWLGARGYAFPEDPNSLDEDSVMEWINKSESRYLKLTHKIFDGNDQLIPLTENEWQEDWLIKKQIESFQEENIPF